MNKGLNLPRRFWVLALFLGPAALTFGCLPEMLCSKQKECAAQELGEDFEAICRVNYRGQLAQLRANDEKECADYADAQEVLDNCRLSLDCEAFNDVEGESCQSEREALVEVLEGLGTTCTSLE